MKRTMCIRIGTILTAFIFLCLVIVPKSNQAAAATISSDSSKPKKEDISTFMLPENSILSETNIYDFSGNQFILYELSPNGYAIYSKSGEACIFLEGSYSTKSPYYEFNKDEYDYFYLGPGEYYIHRRSDSLVFNIITGEEAGNAILGSAYELDEKNYYASAVEENDIEPMVNIYDYPTSPDPGVTTTYNGFTTIWSYAYFKNLYQFPDNNTGTCALVAMCIYLGYLYNYVDTRFLMLNEYRAGNGTTNVLHDHLYDEHTHSILNIQGQYGCPMAQDEIKLTMENYMYDHCSESLIEQVHHIKGGSISAKARSRRIINAGSPVLLVMLSYNTESPVELDGMFHTVVAYGYQGTDKFLTHFGWGAGTTLRSEVIVSSATLYGYYTIFHEAVNIEY